MATYTATLFLPGQAPRVLTADEVLALQPARFELTDRLYLGADVAQVAQHLDTDEAEPLANHYTAAVYGIFNYCDDQALNPAADAHTLRLFNIDGLFGPLLLIEDTTSQLGWVDGLTFIEEQAEPAANCWFQLLHGPAGYYVHTGQAGQEPSHQYGPYTADELQGGRFAASVLVAEQADEPTYPGDLPEAAEREEGDWLTYGEATRGRRGF